MFKRIAGQTSGRADAQLAFDIFAMCFNCADGNFQMFSGVLIILVLSQLQQDGLFPASERFAVGIFGRAQGRPCVGARVILTSTKINNRIVNFFGSYVV